MINTSVTFIVKRCIKRFLGTGGLTASGDIQLQSHIWDKQLREYYSPWITPIECSSRTECLALIAETYRDRNSVPRPGEDERTKKRLLTNLNGPKDKKNYWTREIDLNAKIIISLFVIGLLDKKKFKIYAAKPFKEYDSSETCEGRGQENEELGKFTDIKIKRKISKRDQFNFISEVVEAVADTVVCIEVKDHTSINWLTGVPQTASNGSGFLISEDGLILTNAHVVASGRQRSSISIKLTDGRTFPAHIEDIDYESDLATVKISAKNLPIMPIGASCDTKIGEWVVALGSPLALSNTITAGVVSSVSRGASELGISNDINYIQTDASINAGNSGGPLINLDGEAIGINSMKITAGISFAIPIDYAKKFLARGEARRKAGIKKPTRRYMGITILTLTDQIKKELQARGGYYNVAHGVLVWQVVVGSPAYLAGIQPGDIIIRVNNVDIKSSTDLYDAAKRDATLNVHVQRRDKLYSCTMNPEFIDEEY